MSYNDILSPRPEVLRKEGLDGVIDIENLRDKKLKSLESKPETFLDITYPTTEVKMVIEHLNHRFNTNEKTPGLFLLEGFKGSGKSHLELLVYHLLKNPEVSKSWLQRYRISLEIPKDLLIVIHKFTDFPIDSLWSLIFENLGVKVNQDRIPNLDEFLHALKDRKLVLILDELETGIRSISNDSKRIQNLSFLQMLSEESRRTENASVTIFASVYDSSIEPGTTLKRVNPIDIKFSDVDERMKVVLHRLFQNYETLDHDKVNTLLNSYYNSWNKAGVKVNEQHSEKYFQSFPFSPQLMDMVLFNVKSRGGFQGTRGALGLLGTLLRNEYKKSDIVTSASINIEDAAISNRLSDLDGSKKLIDCAKADLSDLYNQHYASEIIGAALMATLAPSGKIPGINEVNLIKEVLKPDSDVNTFNSTLRALLRYGTFFRLLEENYCFDTEEKPNAKVEYRAVGIDSLKAREHSLRLWKELFNDSNAIVFKDVSQTNSDLLTRDRNSLRLILSPRRLSDDERYSTYKGMENQNQIILLEPRDSKFNALENPDILKWAQRAIAAGELELTSTDERKKQYSKIKNEDNNFIKEAFKRAGLIYDWIQLTDSNEKHIEEESLGNSVTREDVKKYLSQNIFPRQSIEEHLLSRLMLILNKSVREVESDYKKTLGFPVITHLSEFLSAVKNLCKDGKIGLRHERDSACGRLPKFSETEILDARIVEPFEDSVMNESLYQTDNNTAVTSDPIRDDSLIGVDRSADKDSTRQESLYTSSKESVSALRLEVASKLNEYPEAIIKKICFLIFFDQKNIEISSLPSGLKGNLSGNSDLTLDLTITQSGDFTKAQIEQMIEKLPSFTNASYRAELKIKVSEEIAAKNG